MLLDPQATLSTQLIEVAEQDTPVAVILPSFCVGPYLDYQLRSLHDTGWGERGGGASRCQERPPHAHCGEDASQDWFAALLDSPETGRG